MDKKELKELTVSVFERLRQAIKAGDNEKAVALIREIDRNKHDMDESYRIWIDIMLTYIADKMGEEALVEVHRMNGERFILPRHMWMLESKMSPDERARERALMWTYWHGTPIIKMEEDKEKFSITVKCDSGGSIRTWPEYGKTKKAYPWSWGEKGMSYYCAHCAIVLEQMPIEKVGFPSWISEPKPGGVCVQHVFKDPMKTPEKYYKRVGMKKEKKAK